MKAVGIASDHAGVELKARIAALLTGMGYELEDFGAHSTESVDYPDYAHPLANAVESGRLPCGIAICGTGNGMAMTLNKHLGIRAGLCWTPEIASLIRQHNDANICVLSSRFVDASLNLDIVKTFVSTGFEGGRHQRRIDKMADISSAKNK
ncbi:MAG: ribose 5-phosphate isomerase B [Prevotellaceae bacterium]|nr:ribose 5-phosphate isomerase B [Prevotellaceae bacterium]